MARKSKKDDPSDTKLALEIIDMIGNLPPKVSPDLVLASLFTAAQYVIYKKINTPEEESLDVLAGCFDAWLEGARPLN